jgi:uncharacterized Tic20 family protein
MSDQDTPPPMDASSSGNDAPPPMGSGTPGLGSVPTAAPSTAGVGLGQGKLGESDEKTMGMLSHVLGIVTNFVGPLVIWLIKREESPFVNDQGKEALNFQITIAVGYVVSTILGFIPIVQCVAFLLYPALWVVSLVFGILGGLEANKGKAYRYPFALRLIS